MTDTRTRTKRKRARPKPEVKRRVKRREAEEQEQDDSLRKGIYFKLPPPLLKRLAWWARKRGVTKTYILERGLRAELRRMKRELRREEDARFSTIFGDE